MRGVAIVMTVFLALLAQIAAVAPAAAHATLVTSEPADGAMVAAAPARLLLTFNEPVAPLVFRMTAPSGTTTAVQATATGGESLAVALPAGLGEGTHVLSWRVVSLDGHPVGGTVVFSIGAPSVAPVPATPVFANPAVAAALWALKIVLYAALFVGIGGSFFLAWLAPEEGGGRAVLAAATGAGILAAPVLVGLQGADALELPLSGLARALTWQTGFETSFGSTAIVAAIALIVGLLALRASTKIARALSLSGIVLAGLALVLSGHASSAAPQTVTRAAVFVHTVTVAFWTGALVPLATIMSKGVEPAPVLARFSRAIPWAIAALVVSAVTLTVVQLEHASALLATAYGAVLCAKLSLVALLLSIAAWNRYRLTPAIMADRQASRRTLVRSIGSEAAIVLAIIGLVAAWRFTPPPRALVIAANRPALLHIHTAAAMADVTFEPGRATAVRAEIVLMTGDFLGLDAKAVQLTMDNKAAGIEAISRPATKGADAVWRVQQLPLPVGGRWRVQLEILITDFDKVTLESQVDIRE